jgi:hypothetical protein
LFQYQHKLILLFLKPANEALYLFLLLPFPTIQFSYFIFKRGNQIIFFTFLVIFHLCLIFFSKALYHALVSLILIYLHYFLTLDFVNSIRLSYSMMFLSSMRVKHRHQNLNFRQLWILSCYLLFL